MTGAEMLQKILVIVEDMQHKVNDLGTSIKLIEANIKVLNNRAAGVLKEKAIQAVIQNDNSAGLYAAAPEHTAPIDKPMEVEYEGGRVYKKVFGKLINNNNEPIDSVLVKVYDKNNEICATTETDPVGYWETMLTPGRYIAEYTKSGFKTANKTFDVIKSAREIEVK